MILIGIDLGTTACKCMACDSSGVLLAEWSGEYDLLRSSGGYIEQDAEDWWSLVQAGVGKIVCDIGRDKARTVKGLSISSQGISVVPVREDGCPLGMAISWLDTRAKEETEWIRRIFGDQDIWRRTGKRISPAYTLPKLLWLKQHRPELYMQADSFLMPLDFVTMKLTGKQMTDFAMASGTMAFDISSGKWDADILSACGIDPGKLPEAAVEGTLVGMVRPGVAAALGLPDDVQVFLGTQDQKCAALAAGITPGTATISLGTASAISTLSRRPVLDEAMRIPCFALGNGRWILESVIGTACVSLKWLRETFMCDLSYAQMDLLAEQSQPGSGGVCFYPHMEGAGSPYYRNDQHGSIQGLSLSTSRPDLVRSLLEGIAFQIKTNLLVQEDATGVKIEKIHIFGGGSRSDLWCAIIADITGISVYQFPAETAAFGAAAAAARELSAQAAGQLPFQETVHPVRTFWTDSSRARQYEQIYRDYLQNEQKMMGGN